MKRSLSIVIISILVLIILLLAWRYRTCIVYSTGYVEISNKSFDDLNIQRSAWLKNVHVANNLFILGSLSAEAIYARELYTGSSAMITKSIIAGQTTVSGSFDAFYSRFDHIIAYDRLNLDHSIAQSVTVELSTLSRSQNVELSDAVVNGDISFKSGIGNVILRGNSRVFGKITGGVLLNK